MKEAAARRLCVIVMVLAGLIAGQTSGLSLSPAGVVESVDGRVGLKRQGEMAELQTGQELYQGDLLKTDPGAGAVIMIGRNRIRLGPDTSMAITKAGWMGWMYRLSLWLGQLWIYVEKKIPAIDFRVETPAAVAAVRGTLFTVMVEDDGFTRVDVLEGKVAVQPLSGKGQVVLNAGFGTTIAPSRQPEPPSSLEPGTGQGLQGLKGGGKNGGGKQGH